MSTILLVEDNPHIMKINTQALTMQGFQVVQADSAARCLDMLRWHPVDLIVLDIMLPDGNGVDLCRRIKELYPIPILFLTALDSNQDVVAGLRAGGDDYLAKPYDLEVLVARIEARLRSAAQAQRYVSYGCLKLDTRSLCGYVQGQDMHLTQKEYAILLLLARRPGQAVSNGELAMQLWGQEDSADNRALWTVISRLRKKLDTPHSRLELHAQRGGGYILEQM